jgi:hypothetical protein
LALEDWLERVGNAVREACKPDEKGDCLKEIKQCMKTCERARKDPNQRNVLGWIMVAVSYRVCSVPLPEIHR